MYNTARVTSQDNSLNSVAVNGSAVFRPSNKQGICELVQFTCRSLQSTELHILSNACKTLERILLNHTEGLKKLVTAGINS